MAKCIKCKENSSNKTVIYGIIEKYHYDTRRTTNDTDYGPTEYSALGIIEVNCCDKCLKEANKKSNKKALKNIGIAFAFIIAGALLSNVSTEFAGILALVALISLINSIYTFFKNFTTKSKIISALDGKVPKEYVLMPKVDNDLDVEEVPISNDYRQRFYYKYVDEAKLQKPKKETKNNKSYQAALNTLKDYYQQLNKEDIDKSINFNIDKKEVIIEDDIKVNEKPQVEIKEESKIDNNNSKKRKTIILVATAFIVLAILGGVLALLISNGSNSTDVLEVNSYDENLEEYSYDENSVNDLSESTKVDLLWWFDKSYVKYEGTDGNIKATLELDDFIDTVVYEQDDIKIILGYYYTGFGKEYFLYLYKNDEMVDSFLVTLNKNKDLSIGEKIELYIADYERIESYGIVPQYHTFIFSVEKQKTDEITSGETVTKEMVIDFIKRDLTTRYDNYSNLEIEYIKLRKAMFFKMPEGVEDLESLVTLDYDYSVKYKYQDKWYTDNGNIFGTANNPYIIDGNLFTDEYEISNSDDYYDEIEEEYALINEKVNITNYAEFLDLIASDKTYKLIEEGYESEDTVNVIKYCFINEDAYVIY